ncbi:MAG: M28 family peptidase [Gemmatimonadaceae bacterium]
MTFEYSQWPARWGPPLSAAIQLATILAVARTALHQGALGALLLGAPIVIALAVVARNAKRRWTSGFPIHRTRSTNLEARRGTPLIWLVAHVDSKSQTIPMLVRIASSIGLALAMAVSGLVVLISLATGAKPSQLWEWISAFSVLTALPSIFCWVRNRSNGALDNATGVSAVLLAAKSLPATQSLGVLVTSGEELGLAGAREWARSAQTDLLVVNCDTVDDQGGWRLMHTGKKPGRLTSAGETSATRLGFKLSIGRLIPGILADSVAFADRGLAAVTLSRGTLSTLARIHTRRDNSTALSGKGVAEASRFLSTLVTELG